MCKISSFGWELICLYRNVAILDFSLCCNAKKYVVGVMIAILQYTCSFNLIKKNCFSSRTSRRYENTDILAKCGSDLRIEVFVHQLLINVSCGPPPCKMEQWRNLGQVFQLRIFVGNYCLFWFRCLSLIFSLLKGLDLSMTDRRASSRFYKGTGFLDWGTELLKD